MDTKLSDMYILKIISYARLLEERGLKQPILSCKLHSYTDGFWSAIDMIKDKKIDINNINKVN